MKEPIFRLLDADEIECRVGVVNEKGLSLLLYKDARVDFKILDETFGLYGWQRKHQEINGNLFCTISITSRRKARHRTALKGRQFVLALAGNFTRLPLSGSP